MSLKLDLWNFVFGEGHVAISKIISPNENTSLLNKFIADSFV
jgi:hypothetical protein